MTKDQKRKLKQECMKKVKFYNNRMISYKTAVKGTKKTIKELKQEYKEFLKKDKPIEVRGELDL